MRPSADCAKNQIVIGSIHIQNNYRRARTRACSRKSTHAGRYAICVAYLVIVLLVRIPEINGLGPIVIKA